MSDTNKKQTKLTLENLIAKKLQKNSTEKFTKNIYVSKLDGELTFEIPPFDDLLDYSDSMKTRDSKGVKQMYKTLCYDTCKMLHNKELLESYGVVEPYDIIDILFYDIDIMNVGEAITNARNPQAVTEEIKK